MDAKKYSTPQLKAKAQKAFNAFIRERDKDLPCISCQTGRAEQAGHFYSAGKFPHLAFNENNTNGQCVRCNYYGHGELLKYRENLIKKIGQEQVDKLDLLSKMRAPFKANRFYLITIIETYSKKKAA